MCGIAGFIVTTDTPQPDAILRRMTDSIAHRGPDDAGFHVDSSAAIGMRRLSIIDLSAGHQPMTNESGNLWIVYNGEIFNHADLRPALEQAGHRYQTRCDTETILHAYEQYGDDCVSRFRGMFAFAIWDQNARTLFCARDRLGIKPFYYFWDGRNFVFGSEIKVLLKHPAVSASFDESQLSEYLAFGYTSGENTLFAGIRKLMPGHVLRLDLSKGQAALSIERYWDVPRPTQFEQKDDAWWIGECRRRLEETVRMRLMSDVPLGMFLSGGVDSSAIAALIKRMVSGPVKTFAVGYQEDRFSELGYASHVATHLGTEHHEVKVGMEDFFNALGRLIVHEDEPITWPSSVSLYFVSRLAAEHVKVVLTGEGSDELFGGYERYRHNMFNQKWGSVYGVLPGAVRRGLRNATASSSLLSASTRRKIGHTFVGRDASLESLYLDNFYCAFPAAEQQSLLRKPASASSPYAHYLQYWNSAEAQPFLSRMLYADQKTYLVELLMKQDQMSMACSIESRVPFLDHPFVEFAAGVPASLKIRGGESKYILKKAVEDLLPRSIIYRKKMGFPTPLRQWLMEERADPLFSILRDKQGMLSEYLNMPVMNALLDRHRSGAVDATDRIWRLLNLQIWGDIFLKGRGDHWQEGLLLSAASHSAA